MNKELDAITQENLRIDAEIKRRKLAKYEISDAEWQRGINESYYAQLKLESMMGEC